MFILYRWVLLCCTKSSPLLKMDWLSRLESPDDIEELNCIAHFHLFSQLSLIKFLLQVNKFSSETLSTFYRFIEPRTRTKMLHSDAGVWSILLNFLTSMDVFGINQIRDKKGQNPGGKEKKRRKKAKYESKHWLQPPCHKEPMSIYSVPPLCIYAKMGKR